MNPKGVTTKGWWMKVFVKALPIISDASPSDTIFAFLTLNTASPAHKEIFGAKFSSFERLKTIYSYTACYEDI